MIKVDASVDRAPHGTTRAVVARLLDALPELARDTAPRYRPALASLGREIESRIGHRRRCCPRFRAAPAPLRRAPTARDPSSSLEGWFAAISRAKPIVLLIDNAEYTDDPSLGLLAGLARISRSSPLLLVLTECMRREPMLAPGLVRLRAQADRMALSGLSAAETLELTRSLFGDAPERGTLRRLAARLDRGQPAALARDLAPAGGPRDHSLLGRDLDAAVRAPARRASGGARRRAERAHRLVERSGAGARRVSQPAARTTDARALPAACAETATEREVLLAARRAGAQRRSPRGPGRLPLQQHRAARGVAQRHGGSRQRGESPAPRQGAGTASPAATISAFRSRPAGT